MPFDTDSIWSDYYLDLIFHARGGLYASSLFSTDISQFVKNVRMSDTLAEAGQRVEITCDNFQPTDLSPVHVGSDFAIYGRWWTPSGPSEMKRLYHGRCLLDQRDDEANNAERTYVCYDAASFLARHEDVLVYDDTTLSGIFNDLCTRFGLPRGRVAETGPTPTIGRIIQGPGMSLWGVLQEAMNRTYRLTGKRYVIRGTVSPDDGLDYIDLLEMGDTATVWKFHDGGGGNLTAVHFEESAEEVRTKLSLVTEEVVEGSETTRTQILGTTEAASGDALRSTFGVLGKVVSPDGTSDDQAGHDAQLAQEWANYHRTVKKTTIEIIPPPQMRKGDRVFLTSSRGGIASEWIVDTITKEITPSSVTGTLEMVFDKMDAG